MHKADEVPRSGPLAAIVVAAALVGGCATVSCPPVTGDARPVFLLDHGRHASLVLTLDGDVARRYSYGDRRWYAEDDTGIRSGFSALFRDTPSVLMRREVRTPPTLDAVVRAVGVETVHGFEFAVPAPRVDALAAKLDALHAEGAGDPGPEYAPHPVPYKMGYNSNHVVADWLGELGCETRGSPITSTWRTAD